MKYNKKFFIIILMLCFIFFIPNLVLADNLSSWSTILDEAAGGSGAGYDTSKTDPFDSIIGTVIQTLLSFLGVIFLILMIYGGFLWMTAKGNEQQVEKAKNLIMAAVIGLIIVLSAYAISWFVISKLGGGTLSQPTTPPSS